MEEPIRVLYVSSEIFPFLPETTISTIGRYLPQSIQEKGKEIRLFMPKYGVINERRNQLHEVIRLSGMNIVINDVDLPLIIKVSSISSARMQVYFIDNEDYFQRKATGMDDEGNFFPDNDERAMFFARGVLETVKKLRWKPDIIHCQGWISHFLPLYIKKSYSDDPIFSSSKIVLSLFDDCSEQTFSEDIVKKALINGVENKDISVLKEPNGINLAKLAIQHSDGVIYGVPQIDSELEKYLKEASVPTLPYTENTADNIYVEEYNSFYDQILAK